MTPLTERQRLLLAYACTQTASIVDALTALADSESDDPTFPSSARANAWSVQFDLDHLLERWARDQLLTSWVETGRLDYEHTLAHARQYLTERVVELEALLAEMKEGGSGASGTRLAGGPQSDAAQAGGVVPAG